MATNWLHSRQTKYSAYVGVYGLVIVAALAAINFLANRHSTSYDATSNKQYSLADQTVKLVKELKNDAKIVFFDRTTDFRRGKDLLDRYDSLSSKLTVEYIDPDKKPTVAKAYGVRNLGTIYVEANGKREEAKSLSEEEVTSALIRALKTGERTVCAVSGAGEHGLDDSGRSGYSRLKEALERNNYKTRTIKLIEKPEVPKDCTVLVVGGPRFDYVEPIVAAVKKYFEEGGRVLLALDPPLKAGKEDIADNAALVKLVADWGVDVQSNLVLDTSGIGQLFGLSEVVPLVTSYESHIIVREMKDAASAFPLARSLDVKAGGTYSPEKLLASSANSYATNNLRSAEIKLNPAVDKKGPFTLAAAGSKGTATGDNKTPVSRFVVVGSSGFMANNIVGFNGNRDLVLNMFNWLSADEDLISIRPKDPQDRRLNLTRSQMRFVLWSSVFLVPLMVIFAGLSVWWKRR